MTVMVCTHNRAPSLRHTLEALAAQRSPVAVDWEIVIVDNNSRDETATVVREFAARAPAPVTYLFEPRQGVSWARNAGVAVGKGEVVAFTDDDVRPASDWVAMLWTLLSESKADMIGGRILPDWSGPLPGWLARNRWLYGNLALVDHEHREWLVQERGTLQLWCANLAARRSLLDTIGPFDVTLGRVGTRLKSGEDVDMVRRALAAGAHVLYDPRLVVWHKIPEERMRPSYFRRWHFDGAEGMALRAGPPAGHRLLGVSLFSYRWLLARLAAWLSALCRRRDAFERELDFLAAAGRWWGEWQVSRTGRGRHSP
ncbi:MAG: glycosyltransferase [Candidatus Rokubacteria bacterium]|nr:glycosyltransferase [Candidatus Rokubacteria bacterium]